MTKQEEILNELDELLINYAFPKLKGISLGEIVLNYLHSQGVVIKVDRELPDHPFDVLDRNIDWMKQMCRLVQKGMLNAGYEATVPLIEEATNGKGI